MKLVAVERVHSGEQPDEDGVLAKERKSTPDLAVDPPTQSSVLHSSAMVLVDEGDGLRLSHRRFGSVAACLTYVKNRYGELLAGCTPQNPIIVNATGNMARYSCLVLSCLVAVLWLCLAVVLSCLVVVVILPCLVVVLSCLVVVLLWLSFLFLSCLVVV